MKLICFKEHQEIIEEQLKEYKDIDIVLVEEGMSYKGLCYYFDQQHMSELKEYLKGLKQKKTLIGYMNERMYIIAYQDIEYIEGLSKGCYIHTFDHEYQCEYKLYELEELLQGTSFIRISKSVIVNLCFIDYIQSEVNMRYGLYMKSSVKLILSRKYISEFKRRIGKR